MLCLALINDVDSLYFHCRLQMKTKLFLLPCARDNSNLKMLQGQSMKTKFGGFNLDFCEVLCFFQAYFRNCPSCVHKCSGLSCPKDFIPQFKYVSCFHLQKVTSITVIFCVLCSSSEDTQGRDPERVLTRLSLMVRLVTFILNWLPLS